MIAFRDNAARQFEPDDLVTGRRREAVERDAFHRAGLVVIQLDDEAIEPAVRAIVEGIAIRRFGKRHSKIS